MAFNIRSIMGRNNPNPGPPSVFDGKPNKNLTIGDVETAKAHGITSRRTMKKNLGDIRTVQQSQYMQNSINQGYGFGASWDPLSDNAKQISDDGGAAGSRLGAAGVKDQKSIKSKVKSLGNRDNLQAMARATSFNPFK